MNSFSSHLVRAYRVPGSVIGTEAAKANFYYPLNLNFFLQRRQIPLSLHVRGYKRSLHLTNDRQSVIIYRGEFTVFGTWVAMKKKG